jgi:tyrosyl-tRNA synthetase
VTHILDELRWRGVLAQTTDPDALRAAMDAGPVTFYCGFDPTAPSLHFGNLGQLITMRRLQQAGHRPIGLVGGATGLIGDPSGRTSERVLNEAEVVESWVARIRSQVERYLDFDGPVAATMVNNLDWTAELSALDLLRDIGKHFPVNRMLDREAVSARLAAGGISYTEFSYQILQSLDFLELYRRHGCVLQTGGSDQWGNITAGVDLIRRVTAGEPHGLAHALSTTLLTKADGTKFGKTADGAVWLDPGLTSPYAFYQYFLNVDDADVPSLLRYFTFRGRDEIEDLEAQVAAKPAARAGQRVLAEDLTALVHGADELAAAQQASRALFGQGDLAALPPGALEAALREAGLVAAEPAATIADLLVATGLAASKGAARRTVAEGGAYLNNVRVEDPAAVPAAADRLGGRFLVLRRGRKAFAGVEYPI